MGQSSSRVYPKTSQVVTCGCGLTNSRLCANHIRLGWVAKPATVCGCGSTSKRLCANHIRLGWTKTV